MTFDAMGISLPARYHDLEWWQRRAVREEYIRQQDGDCWHCGEPLTGPPAQRVQKKRIRWRAFPPTFRKHPVHLQHDHNTGLTEGAVHMLCNAVLWQYHGR